VPRLTLAKPAALQPIFKLSCRRLMPGLSVHPAPQRPPQQPQTVAMPAVPAAVAIAEDRQAKTDATKNQYIILAECALRLHLQYSSTVSLHGLQRVKDWCALGVVWLCFACCSRACSPVQQSGLDRPGLANNTFASSAGVSKRWSRSQREPLTARSAHRRVQEPVCGGPDGEGRLCQASLTCVQPQA